MKNFSVIFILSLLFYSCANLPSSSMPQNFDSKDQEGYIVGAFSIHNQKPIFNAYSLYFNTIDSLGSNKIRNRIYIVPEQILKMKFHPDFFDENKAVYYFAYKRPPGFYKFNLISLFENGGMYQSEKNIPVDLPFEVKSGMITYVGEIELNYKKNKVVLNDKKARDLPKLKEKTPTIDWDKLLIKK